MADRLVFNIKVIKGMTFEGRISADGPYISLKVTRDIRRGVALGFPIFLDKMEDGVWAVFKYDHDQLRFSMPAFTDGDAMALSEEFGIAVWPQLDALQDFFDTPAGIALAEWVTAHPRISKDYAHLDSYIPRWLERAQEASHKNLKAA